MLWRGWNQRWRRLRDACCSIDNKIIMALALMNLSSSFYSAFLFTVLILRYGNHFLTHQLPSWVVASEWDYCVQNMENSLFTALCSNTWTTFWSSKLLLIFKDTFSSRMYLSYVFNPMVLLDLHWSHLINFFQDPQVLRVIMPQTSWIVRQSNLHRNGATPETA